MLVSGSCHCGNVAFTLDWSPDPTEIPARACSCSFCTKHGGVWTSCPTGSLKVSIEDSALVSTYCFATRTAEFRVCARCGVVPLVTSRIDGRLHAVVNVNTLEGVEPSLVRRAPASFDGEVEEARLARRQRNWIGDVEFVERRAPVPATGLRRSPR
ncbi:MAG: GFA family protein [Caldimonas sp.]